MNLIINGIRMTNIKGVEFEKRYEDPIPVFSYVPIMHEYKAWGLEKGYPFKVKISNKLST